MAKFLFVLLFSNLLVENVPGSSQVIQWPPSVRVQRGDNVTLYCELHNDGVQFNTIYPYWYITERNRESSIFYPENPSSEFKGRVSLVNEESGFNLSLKIHYLQPNDSNVYICMVSAHRNGHRISIRGNGTRLDVYDIPRELEPLPLYTLVLVKTVVFLALGAVYHFTKSSTQPDL
ncbi:hypothetical protein scyTo_0013999 [Scyliorhinus torazame]|uniref:Ig-like domain-containing protein n=1 Tax=Scyliorhinus torazame TaxID=75743 RepID=A0A401NFL0_SCYTO|nr:hypothetical protein [Scyliorhinus torazame]